MIFKKRKLETLPMIKASHRPNHPFLNAWLWFFLVQEKNRQQKRVSRVICICSLVFLCMMYHLFSFLSDCFNAFCLSFIIILIYIVFKKNYSLTCFVPLTKIESICLHDCFNFLNYLFIVFKLCYKGNNICLVTCHKNILLHIICRFLNFSLFKSRLLINI